MALGIATRDSRLLTALYIAFATHAGLDGLTRSDRIAADELERRGSAVIPVPWSSTRDWTRFDAVCIRATWDYYQRPADFLAWLRMLEGERVPLWNPARLASWNMQKGYLRDLERAGVLVVPTVPHVDLPGGDVWWDVAPAEVSGQEWVQTLRAKYEQARGAQKWFG